MKTQQIFLEKIREGKGTTIITIDGFLNEGNDNTQDWNNALKIKYPNNPWFHLHWESENINKLIKKTALSFLLAYTIPTTMIFMVTSLISVPIVLIRFSGVILTWRKALKNSEKAGESLPKIIEELKVRKIILIGHSLGTRVIYHCLKNIKTKTIFEIHLLGGAVNNNKLKWKLIEDKIENRIFNYHSDNDRILQSFYKVGALDNNPIGREKIETKKTSNINVTELVKGHTEFKTEFHKYMN
jgi:predicted alpha/beta hydrolase family esterase